MTRVRIGQLRDHVSRYVRLAEHGETVVIVNRDREVAVLQPRRPAARRRRGLLGCMKGTGRVRGDIVHAGVPAREWFKS